MFENLETPQNIVDTVETKLQELGAQITHQYDTIMKGFAFSASKDKVDEFKQEEKSPIEQFPFVIEDDGIATAYDGEKNIGSDKKA